MRRARRAAALELRDLERTTAARDIQIGITHGRLRSGTYGHAMRRTFVCLGDAVNLVGAADVEGPAERQIYVSEPVQRGLPATASSGDSSSTSRVKGKAAPVVAYCAQRLARARIAPPTRVRAADRRAARRARRCSRTRLAEAAGGGSGSIVGIAAEAGMGKSRLVAEFVRERGGPTRPSSRSASASRSGRRRRYFVWREIWRRLLDVDDEHSATRQRSALEVAARPDRSGARRARAAARGRPRPDIPDTELTASFDAKLRKTSLEDLLADCLRARAADASRSSSCSRTATGSTRCRATCSTWSRGPADAAGPVRPRLPAGRRHRAAAWASSGSPSSRDRARRARRRPRRRRSSAPSSAAARRRTTAGGAGGARRPDRRASRGEPVLRRGAAQLLDARASISRDDGALARAGAARKPPQPRPQPHRHAARGAATHVEGRERHRPGLPGAGAARRLPGPRVAGRRPRPPRIAPRRRSRPPRPGGRRVVPVQARGHPGGRLREPPVRAPGGAARRSAATSSDAGATHRAQLDLLAHHYWHRTTRPRRSSISAVPGTRRRRPTRTPRRSTT